nr:unnamed protein product [Callosobruchus analis]
MIWNTPRKVRPSRTLISKISTTLQKR